MLGLRLASCSWREEITLTGGERISVKRARLWHWSNALLFVLLLASGLINPGWWVTAVKSPQVYSLRIFVTGMLAGFVLINAVSNGHLHRIRRQGGC